MTTTTTTTSSTSTTTTATTTTTSTTTSYYDYYYYDDGCDCPRQRGLLASVRNGGWGLWHRIHIGKLEGRNKVIGVVTSKP